MDKRMLDQIDAILKEKERLNRIETLSKEAIKIHEALQKEKEKLFGPNRSSEKIEESEMNETYRLINEYNKVLKELNTLLLINYGYQPHAYRLLNNNMH